MVDPGNAISEIHEDNNKAYAQLPILGLPTGGQGALSISAADIVSGPATPHVGDRVQISATIHASANQYTWVAVEFWGGEPGQGGTMIDGRLLPMIGANQAATVSIEWPAIGPAGPKEFYVVVRQPNDVDVTDNQASVTVQVVPALVHLPLIDR